MDINNQEYISWKYVNKVEKTNYLSFTILFSKIMKEKRIKVEITYEDYKKYINEHNKEFNMQSEEYFEKFKNLKYINNCDILNLRPEFKKIIIKSNQEDSFYLHKPNDNISTIMWNFGNYSNKLNNEIQKMFINMYGKKPCKGDLLSLLCNPYRNTGKLIFNGTKFISLFFELDDYGSISPDYPYPKFPMHWDNICHNKIAFLQKSIYESILKENFKDNGLIKYSTFEDQNENIYLLLLGTISNDKINAWYNQYDNLAISHVSLDDPPINIINTIDYDYVIFPILI